MSQGNDCVVYKSSGEVEVVDIGYPKMEMPKELGGRQINHGVILELVATNICGSDQHMVRGRTAAEPGQTLGHEPTGKVVEVGGDVETLKVGDIVSVPFNVACGRCRMCKMGRTGVCDRVNTVGGWGAAYGYVNMSGWIGGQAEFLMVPYADWNCLKLPDTDEARSKIMDLALLSDIFPTGFHGAVTAGVGPGSTVYIAGAGPVGLASATGAFLLGAAHVIVGDLNQERLTQAESFGCIPLDVKKGPLDEQIASLLGRPEVDCAVDCVGFEASGHGTEATEEKPAAVLNGLMDIVEPGGGVGIPGLYVTGDPGASDANAKEGRLSIRIGKGWAKSQHYTTGQCPVMRYNHSLMEAILGGRADIAKNVGAKLLPLEEAPQGYRDFDQGASVKYILDPHGLAAAMV
ncbi:formaldehyde dehydrogenase, glutathione-independent [Demetria terragena]|uniref:formaldehyde dehydrogenase, glutathione-independent n=1 Tax=Demetria terragena TaxID=63959 RepID=UPI000378B559|nr:formaldehyde dehydrogenase, glutathione-independent [Demetria terragena]